MISALVTLIIYLIVIGILLWLVYYVLDAIPVPEPFNRWAKLLLVVVAVLIIIVLLLQLVGSGGNINLPSLR